MEIEFSSSRLRAFILLVLCTLSILLIFQKARTDEDFRSGFFSLLSRMIPAEDSGPDDQQPAIQALAVIYNPAGEQTSWEQSVCANMTLEGCDLFKFYYAPAIWQSKVGGSDPHFIEVAETLEDGSQIWQADVTLNGEVQPLFLHVQKREDGQWALARLLFEEEAAKYEN